MTRRLRLRTRLFLAFALLVTASLALSLAVARDLTERRVRDGFAERFGRARAAFRELEQLRVELVREEIAALVRSHPQLRTVLSTASIGAEDLGFGAAPDPLAPLRDANLRLRSLLPSVPLAQRSDVFLVASASGALVFSKADPERTGDALGALAPGALLEAVLRGGAGEAVWVPQAGAGVGLAPAAAAPAVYLMVGERVAFGDEVHGAVLAGRRLGPELLARLREITGLEIALVAGGEAVASTLSTAASPALAEALRGPGCAEATGASAQGAAWECELAGERFLAARAEIVPGSFGAQPPVGFVLLGSQGAELRSLAALERSLAAIGALVLVAAVGVAFALARGLTRPGAELAAAARRIGAGDLEASVSVGRSDELGALGLAFNQMVAGLRERDRIRRSFERHVSPEVAEAVLRDPALGGASGSRREVSVLFADVGGFTTLSESVSPERVVALLNEYFDAVCAIVLESGGTVNELRGDGILAFWGAPVAAPDHAARACAAALRCRERLARLDAEWVARGLRPRRFRIGVHTGEVVVGEIGTRERAKYGAVGDAVNLASRLEGANKFYGTSVLVSEATRVSAGPGFAMRELDRIRVAGREAPVRIYELVGVAGELGPEACERQRRYEAALASYRAREWEVARARLEALRAEDPADGAARALLDRLERLRASPPPAGWDGVWDLDTK